MPIDSIRPIFKKVGDYCNYCYLNFEDSEKKERIIFQKKVNDTLEKILKFY